MVRAMENEALIRLSFFVGLFALFAGIEAAKPARPRVITRARRWFTNWSIVVIDTLALRAFAFVVPMLAVGAAIDAGRLGWGLFNATDWPLWLEGLLAILILDFAIWAQHLITHKIPILWRLHRVHHADTEVDVTTAIRFHPIEILLSMALKIGLVYLLGPAAWAVVAFEVLLNGTAMFNHANFALPRWLEPIVRAVLVTPDMHRIHHSTKREEHDSNYGFALSIWDRMFRTYIGGLEPNHKLGLKWQDDRPAQLGWSLMLPFRK